MPPNWVIWHSAQKSCKFDRKSRVIGIYFLRKSEGLLVRYMNTMAGYNPCIAAITAWCVAGHEFQLGALFKMDCNLALDMKFGLMHCGTCCVLMNVAANTHCNSTNSVMNMKIILLVQLRIQTFLRLLIRLKLQARLRLLIQL